MRGKARGGRIDRRLADMSAAPAAEAFLERFDPDELQVDRVDFDLGPEVRCIQKMTDWKNRVVWFAVMVEVFDGGHWRQVARADTCHDEAHVHYFTKGRRAEMKRRTLRPLTTVDDVEQAFDEACDLLVAEWEENLRRWRNG